MLKFSLLLFSLLSMASLNAQEAYEKEFIHLVNEKVKDGNITAVKNVGCQKGDCRIEGLVYDNVDMETGEKNTISIATFTLKSMKDFMELKEGHGVLKEDEKRQFALELSDIKSDGHNLFFDKEKMAKELGAKSETYLYFKKYLDTPTNGQYKLSMHKKSGDVMMKDAGTLSSGSFQLGMKNSYTIKGGFEKLEELSNTNPMLTLSYIVINSIEINVNNPKGFLKNLMYITYKSEMQEATTKEERVMINEGVLLSGDKMHSKKEFSTTVRKNAQKRMQEMAAQDPEFNKLLNKNKQLEKKIDAILAGTSKSIDIKIENPLGLSLGDFATLFMGYAMQQKLVSKPDITVTIK